MSKGTNPQSEAILDELADLISESLQGKETDLADRRDQLLESLVMSGYGDEEDQSFVKQVEDRVKDRCGDPLMSRGGALSSMTSDLGAKFKEISRWQATKPTDSKSPADQSPPKAANISSATDA